MSRSDSTPPDDIAVLMAAIRAELESHEFASLEAAQEHLNRMMNRRNAVPQPDLGGLTPDELYHVLHGDWRGLGPLRMMPNLPLAAAEVAPWFVVARLLLRIIEESGGIKLTPAGNLPKAVVGRLVESVLSEATREHWSGQGVERVKEQDLQLIHLPRVLLEVGGLMKRRKGHLVLSKEGRGLLPDARAGELYARLFETCFRRFNLGYLDGAQKAPVFQQLIGYPLVRLRDLASDWVSVERVVAEALHPMVRPNVPVPPHGFDDLPLIATTRLLRPLERFALVEQRELPRTPEDILPRFEVRKTPLYDLFLVDGRLRVRR